MTRRQRNWTLTLSGLLTLWFVGGVPLKAQVSHPVSFLADKYEVSAYVDTVAQGINAIANVRVELHENLEVREVKGEDGKPLTFQREADNPLFLSVMLPTPVGVGKTATLTFSYGGLLANEENSPVPNTKMASINKEWSYLLLPARWFPLTNFPANRYSAT